MKTNIFILLFTIIIAAGCNKGSELVEPPPPPPLPPEAPIVDFDFTVKSSPLQNVVLFTSKCKNATSYSWDFGDGKTSTDSVLDHAYTTGGTYTVALTAKGPGGEVKITKQVTVASPFTKFVISSIELRRHKSFQYDDIAFGSQADIFIVVKQGSLNFSSASNPAYNTAYNFQLFWNFSGPVFEPLSEPIEISIWDYDNPSGGDANDLIYSFTFRPSDYTRPPASLFPTEMYLKSTDNETMILVNCNWQ